MYPTPRQFEPRDQYMVFNDEHDAVESHPTEARAQRAVENLTEHSDIHGHGRYFYWKGPKHG